MSGPNTSYDPVQVTPLKAASVDAMVTEALAAFAAATSVAELKQARLAHAGERSPIALANREIGALPPQARKEAGVRVGRARGTINHALKAREEQLKADELARILVEERVDVTLPVQTQPLGAVHPITALMDLMADVFIAMGWEVAEGPELEAEWMNFDALNFIPDHPARTMQDTLFVEPEDGGIVSCRSTSSVRAGSIAPMNTTLPTFRSSTRSRDWQSTRALRSVTYAALLIISRKPCSGILEPGSDPITSPSPSHRLRSTCNALSATAPPSVIPIIPVAPARARAGSNGVAAAWSIRECSRPVASTPTSIRASPSVWVSIAL